jgi:pimeloyl-ACP methyl ester carboxylesterase
MRVIAPDLTGHGRSAPWPEPEPFSFRRDVDAVVELVRSAAPADLIGHSYGGLVALHAALAAPAALRSLAVFDPVVFGVLDDRDRDARAILDAIDLRWGPRAEDREHWLRAFVDFWGGPGAWDALREDARGEFRRVAWAVHEGVHSLMDDRTPASAFAQIAVPVQLVTGELSPLPARRVIERLAEAIPHARVAIIPHAGHLAPVSDAAAVNAVLLDHLR